MYVYPTLDQTCANCAHWDTRHMVNVSASDPHGLFGRVSHRLAPCSVNAVEIDAGCGGVAMLGPDSHCLAHDAAWEPSAEFMSEQIAYASDFDNCGVRPGIDYPATLSPYPAHVAL